MILTNLSSGAQVVAMRLFKIVLFVGIVFYILHAREVYVEITVSSVGIHYRSYRKVVIGRASSVTPLDDASRCQRPVEKNRSSSGIKS